MQSPNVCPVFDTGTDVITARSKNLGGVFKKVHRHLIACPALLRFNSACPRSPAATFREIRSTAWHAAPRYPPEVEMTVVAIWLEPTEQVLWSIADTRISAPGPTGGRKIMTDSG